MTPAIPNLPTDNLYKFLALSGLFLFLFCLTFLLFDLGSREQLLGSVKVDLLELDQLEGRISSKLDIMEAGTLTDNSVKQTREMVETYTGKHFELSAKIASLNSEVRVTQRKMAEIGFWFGLFISTTGFYLWYYLVQRHLDEILKLNLRKARQELPMNSKEN